MPERSSPPPNPNSPTLVYVLLLSPQLPSDISSVEPHCMTYSSGIRTFCLFHLTDVGWIFYGKRHSVSSWEIIDTFWLCAGSVLSFVCLYLWLVPWQARAALKNCLRHKDTVVRVQLCFSHFLLGIILELVILYALTAAQSKHGTGLF